MPVNKFKSCQYPSDAYISTEVGDWGNGVLCVTAAFRYAGNRNFDRVSVILDKKSAIELVRKLAVDLGLSISE